MYKKAIEGAKLESDKIKEENKKLLAKIDELETEKKALNDKLTYKETLLVNFTFLLFLTLIWVLTFDHF